jgi:hypothetical protein
MGKPPLANPEGSIAEYIGGEKITRGSEPSQYPQEQKTIVIPLVAASERGTAQTIVLARWGCRARHTELQTNSVVERSGTIGHRR